MIAAAVQMLATYIRNFVLETPGTLVVPAPYEIVLPPLRVYTFIQVTGRVIARTVGGSDIGAESTKSMESPRSEPPAKKQQKLQLGGPGSSSGKVPPKVMGDDGDGEDEEMDGDEEEEEDGGDNDDDDLARLESLEEELKHKTPTKRGRPKTKAKAKKAQKLSA